MPPSQTDSILDLPSGPLALPAKLTDEWVKQYQDNRWLGLGDTSKLSLPNPFKYRTKFDIENPHVFLLDLMRNPDNFGFTCKVLFGKTLAPFQIAILRELWIRPFPMLVGCRGAGKSFILAVYVMLRTLFNQGSKVVICGAAFRQAKVVFDYCQELWESGPVYRDIVGPEKRNGPRRDIDRCSLRVGDSIAVAIPIGDGCLSAGTLVTYSDRFGTIAKDSPNSQNPIVPREASVWGNKQFRCSDEAYFNGKSHTKKITTKRGYEVEGTHNHKIRILRGVEVIWERLDSLRVGDHVLLDRSYRWHKGGEVPEEEAYALGLMIGDGCWTDPYKLGYATQDEELIEAVRKGTGLSFSQTSEDDPHHFVHNGKQERALWLKRWGLKCSYAHEKVIPPLMLCAGRESMAACVRGIFDTDGHCQVSEAKGGTSASVSLTTTSQELARQVHYILLHFGIIATLGSRERDENWREIWELHITGSNVVRFVECIGFGLKRKSEELAVGLAAKVRSVDYSDGVPGISQVMAVAASIRRLSKGEGSVETRSVSPARLRSRKRIGFGFIDAFLRVHGKSDPGLSAKVGLLADRDVYYDEVASIEDGECDTYDIHVPDGHEYCANGFFSHNTKIRGQRANIIISDEFASVPQEIFETVIRGFAAVAMSPVEKYRDEMKKEALKEIGLWTKQHEDIDTGGLMSNQTVISGTAYYAFNHFFEYWKRYKAIVESRGDERKLSEVFSGKVPEKFNWKDYSVMRIPVHVLPPGFMDQKQIAQAKATIDKSAYDREYGAVFATDSNGFFKRSLIESCVVGRMDTPIEFPNVGVVKFSAVLRGNPGRTYVMAIDPASEDDNFSCVILECWENHRRIVFCWTTTRSRYKSKKQRGLAEGGDFYAYTARKIRDLMVAFNVERIAIDGQGGGVAVIEALQDPANMKEGERAVLPIIEADDPKESDNLAGNHCIEVIQFARADWVRDANHGLRKDFEDKALLFPYFDPAIVALAHEDDKEAKRVVVDNKDMSVEKLYDTLEDAVLEIEALKDELATIVHSQTGTAMRDRWDTPETKVAGGKKGRLRKDRYSSLLMANMIGRVLQRTPKTPAYKSVGGFAHEMNTKKTGGGAMYVGPAWYVNGISGSSGAVVKRQ